MRPPPIRGGDYKLTMPSPAIIEGEPGNLARGLDRKQLPALDGIRAVAVFLVIIFHASLPFMPGPHDPNCLKVHFRLVVAKAFRVRLALPMT